jgi:predicted nucleic acid-binding protein
MDGAYDLVVSPLLLAELRRALAYPKLSRRISPADAEEFVGWLARSASVADDPDEAPPARSPDPADDYLHALAAAEVAILVSGDRHLLSLGAVLPIESSARFLERLGFSLERSPG